MREKDEKIKTNELIGKALDCAAAIAQGAVAEMQSGGLTWLIEGAMLGYVRSYIPSEDWAQGVPIIEKEKITLKPNGPIWVAYAKGKLVDIVYPMEGQTALIAAMRAFVASKLGDEVEVPGELL